MRIGGWREEGLEIGRARQKILFACLARYKPALYVHLCTQHDPLKLAGCEREKKGPLKGEERNARLALISPGSTGRKSKTKEQTAVVMSSQEAHARFWEGKHDTPCTNETCNATLCLTRDKKMGRVQEA